MKQLQLVIRERVREGRLEPWTSGFQGRCPNHSATLVSRLYISCDLNFRFVAYCIIVFLSQSTEVGLHGVTGQDVRRPVERDIKYSPEHVPIPPRNLAGKIAREI